MRLASRYDLERLGFSGFLSVTELRESTEVVPRLPGVYAVLWENKEVPSFLEVGTGGHFKGIDPNVSLHTLQQNWIAGSEVVYIGKASGGSSGKRGLRKRLDEYMEFGRGRPVGHKGGRYIWQLRESGNLTICWKEVRDSPEALESEMLNAFVVEHGRLPFANLRH
jgi:hypothetical protein